MQPELAVDGADFRGPDQSRMGNRHGMQRPFESFEPELEEAIEHWKSRAEVVVLPDIGLQQRRMIGKPIQYLRSGEAVAFNLASKIFGYHWMPSDSDISLSVTSLHRQAQNL